MVGNENVPLRGRTAQWEMYAKLSDVPIVYSAKVSFRDCGVDQTAQLVPIFSVRYVNCADGKLRSGVHDVRGNLRV